MSNYLTFDKSRELKLGVAPRGLQPNLLDLPDEILEKIISKAGRDNSLLLNKRILNISKKIKWKNLTLDLSKEINLKDFKHIENLKIICTLQISKEQISTKIKKLKYLKNLKTIFISVKNLDLDFNQIENFKLKDLPLDSFIIIKTLKNLVMNTGPNVTQKRIRVKNFYVEMKNTTKLYDVDFSNFLVKNYFDGFENFIFNGSKNFFIIYDFILKLLISSIGQYEKDFIKTNKLLIEKTNDVIETLILRESFFPGIEDYNLDIKNLKYFKYLFITKKLSLISFQDYFKSLIDFYKFDYDFSVTQKNIFKLKHSLEEFYNVKNLTELSFK